MGMPRLRHVPAILMITAAALVAACARAPAQPGAPPQPSTGAEYGRAADARPAPQPYAQPTATATGVAPGGVAGLDEPPAGDVAGLEAQLDRAERALGLVLGPDRVAVAQAGQGATAPVAPAASGGAVLADPCLIACAALASMRRSADHLCGMAGEADAACGGARERVQRAEQRVVQACPACASR